MNIIKSGGDLVRNRRKKCIAIMLVVLIVVLVMGIYFTSQNNKVKQLTSEEKLEDFEYLYSFVSENYPFLRVNERVNGINWLDHKDEFKSAIKNTSEDYEFIYEIGNIVNKLNDGHTHVIADNMFLSFYQIYSGLPEESGYQPWVEVLKSEIVAKRYKLDEKNIQVSEQHNLQSVQSYCKTDIISPGEVAYLRIYEMNHGSVEKDGIIIRNFLEEIKDYEKLIIDIRRNMGGDDMYWMKNIIEPLINESISAENFVFVRGDYEKNFYESLGYEFSPVTELDESTLSDFPEEIATDFKYYDILTTTFNPIDPVGFKGEIYLLVDRYVYSSADTFASFSKDSGFATLVGKTTAGGGGAGADPIFFSLPNSGIVIRFSGDLVLNSDGNIHEEIRTIPDIDIDATMGTTYERDKAIQLIINEL